MEHMTILTFLQIIYVHTQVDDSIKPGDGDTTHRSWAYIGSANCSESAWGKLFKDRATKLPKINCRNWECGVLLPVRDAGKRNAHSDLSDFEKIVPVPMKYPGESYGDRKPWYYSEE